MRGAAVVELGGWLGVLTAVTVVAVSTVTPAELVVAVAAAVCGAVAARTVRRAAGVVVPGGTHRAGRAAAVLPWSMASGVWVLLRTLARRHRRGAFRSVRLPEGTDPAWAGVVLAASADTCVLDVAGRSDVLLHTPAVMENSAVRVLTGDEAR
ncbi:hypothetical protein [Peterkaempfera griseoplana]|uniref:hypothetical protein n=1 Tax=Peterkaempfera griseoplana TaxID=66896 RepID=UPI0006E454DB|nr:hypothetical protein [Peterkaempfera griseoplana]